MLKKYKLGWPSVVLAGVAIASLALVLTFAPDDTREAVVEWLGWGVAGVASFLGPILRRRLDDEGGDE